MSIILLACILSSSIASSEPAVTKATSEDQTNLSKIENGNNIEKSKITESAISKKIITYEEYIKSYTDETKDNPDIQVNLQQITALSENGVQTDAMVEGKPAVVFNQDGASAEWKVLVNQSGFYHIELLYCPIEGKQTDIQSAIYINNEQPFDEAYMFLMKRQYSDGDGIKQDIHGNDVRPAKKEVFEWNTIKLTDKNGVYNIPYYFHFEAGENKLRLDLTVANVAIGGIRIYNDVNAPSYAKYAESLKDLSNEVTKDDTIIIQGENTWRTTDTVLYATYDRQNYLTQSSDNSVNNPAKLKLNTIGQSIWKIAGQKITWQFDVEKAGYYEIGMHVRQNQARGIFSTREIMIDGEVLFSELNALRVDYNADWQIKVLGEATPYKFYFKEGSHTISMVVAAGALGEYVQKLQKLILELNQLYREIIMITGTSPDSYRDYKLEQEIVNLQERMQNFVDRIRSIETGMETLDIKAGSDMVVAEQLALRLESFIKKPRSIAARLSNFQDSISSLSSWALSLTEQPLEIDYIFIQSPDAKKHQSMAGMIETMEFRLKSFLSTFVEDYTTLSESKTTAKESLTVWSGLGRDQAQIIKDMIDNDFSPDTGISIKLSLVQQGIVEAIAAGKGPDVMLYAGDVINLAARHALLNLNTMKDFDQVKIRFSKDALVPFTYENGIYALPLEQNFLMMFYRTDIFEELGLKVPETWDEFNLVIMALQKNKLTAGVPVGTETAADVSLFSTLLYQMGGSFYTDNYSATKFDSEEALEAFTQWTEFYTKYRLPQSYTLLTRFRSGEMPLALANYTTYNTFAVAAPEIKGLWRMTPIPGVIKEDGSIDHTSISSSTPALIFKTCKYQQAAFSFINWFTSAKTQSTYGMTVENVLGSGARYDPANIEALENLNWTGSELNMLKEQINESTFTPIIPATYYVTRNLTNAYRSVTVKSFNPRESLYSYNIEINAEITRKRNELNLK